MVSAAALTAALTIAAATAVDVEGRAAGNMRHLGPEDGPSRTTWELLVVPRVAATFDAQTLVLSGSYAPQLFLPLASEVPTGSPTASQRLEALHRGDVRLRDALGPLLTVELTGDISYGDTDLLREAEWTAQQVPTAERITYRSAHASTRAAWTPSARSRVALELSLLESGGVGDAAKLLPLHREARLGGMLSWDASRLDVVSLDVATTLSRSGAVTDSANGRAAGTWERALAPFVSARAAAGIAGTWSDVRGSGSALGVAPWGELAIANIPPPPHLGGNAFVRVEPGIDRLTGLNDQRVELRAAATWVPSRPWSLELGANGTAIRPSSGRLAAGVSGGRVWVAMADGRVTRQLGNHASLSWAAFARSQRSSTAALSFNDSGALLELSFWARPRNPVASNH